MHKWIGVSGGYLGNFSYASHQRFWLETCDIYVNTAAYGGTTRAHFEETLYNAEPMQQAAALRAILEDYPRSDDESGTRTELLEKTIRSWITRLETGAVLVEVASLESATEVVRRALSDAESLMAKSGAQSAVDRVHTAMHGYLKSVCDAADIEYAADPTMTRLLKSLRREHPAFDEAGPREDDVRRIMNSLGSILDALNPLRNRASVAHPNDEILREPEAMLVVNTVRTLLTFVEMKLGDARS